MGYYKNDSDQAVRVRDDNGRLRRVPKGGVIQAEGEFEKNLKSTKGVSSASEDEYQRTQPSSDLTRDQQRMNAVSDALAYANTIVHARLNEVVGDDDAPYGPPSGTITTKQAVKDNTDNPVEHDRFAQHEWTEKSAKDRDLSPVQQAQADASAVAEKVTQAGLDGDFEVSAEDIKGLSGPERRGGRGDRTSAKVRDASEKRQERQQRQSSRDR